MADTPSADFRAPSDAAAGGAGSSRAHARDRRPRDAFVARGYPHRLRDRRRPWPVKADPAELEFALLNIGLNARDAMPAGGVLRVEAHNVAFAEGEDRENGLVGEYVALTLSDSGTGIDPETLPRVFEPFFTTKEIGKGTGLGLSQVYGFAKQ